MTALRLTFRQHGFELVTAILVCLALAAASIYLVWRLGSVAMPTDCLYGSGPLESPVGIDQEAHDRFCQPYREAFSELAYGWGGRVMAGMAVLPILVGVFVGVPMVARELEQGTAPLAWTLGRSRKRWYLTRIAPVALVLALLLALAAFAAEALEGASNPLVDPGASFTDYSLRGGLVVVVGLLAFAVAVLTGAVSGRQLPSVLLAGALTVGLALALETGLGPHSARARSLMTWVSPGLGQTQGSLSFDSGFRDPLTGQVYSYGDVPGATRDANGNYVDEQWVYDHFETVTLDLPGSRRWDVASVHGLAGLGLAALALAGGLLVVDRRRP